MCKLALNATLGLTYQHSPPPPPSHLLMAVTTLRLRNDCRLHRLPTVTRSWFRLSTVSPCHLVALSPCRLWSVESLVASDAAAAAGRPAFIVHFMANCNFHFNLRCTAVEGKPAEHTLLCNARSESRVSLISRLGSTSTAAAYNFVYILHFILHWNQKQNSSCNCGDVICRWMLQQLQQQQLHLLAKTIHLPATLT